MRLKPLLNRLGRVGSSIPKLENRLVGKVGDITNSWTGAAALGTGQAALEYSGKWPLMPEDTRPSLGTAALATALNTVALKNLLRKSPKGVYDVSWPSAVMAVGSTPAISLTSSATKGFDNLNKATGNVNKVTADAAGKSEKFTSDLADASSGLRAAAINAGRAAFDIQDKTQEGGALDQILATITQTSKTGDKIAETVERFPETITQNFRKETQNVINKFRQSIGQPAARAGLGGLGGLALGTLLRPEITSHDTPEEARRKERSRRNLPLLLAALGAGGGYYADRFRK